MGSAESASMTNPPASLLVPETAAMLVLLFIVYPAGMRPCWLQPDPVAGTAHLMPADHRPHGEQESSFYERRS